jgi:PAS domain S-box-containing protein
METLLVGLRPQRRQLLSEALGRRGHEVRAVEDADAACAALREGGYRLVIFEADGREGEDAELCRRLRAASQGSPCMLLAAGCQEWTSRAPTGHRSAALVAEAKLWSRWSCHRPEHLQALLAAGADDYLTDLDDDARLGIRLAVAEHRLRAPAACGPAGEPFRRLPIKSSPVLYHAPYGAARASLEGKFLEVNPAMVAMLGYDSEEELLGCDLGKDVYRDPQARSQLMAQVADRPGTLEMEWKRKDGTPITVRAHGWVVCDAAGKPVEVEGIIEDITERRQALSALRTSEERLRHVLENMPVMLDAFDAHGNIIVWNHECERVTGYRAEEIIGNSQAMHWLYPDDSYRKRMVEEWARRTNDYRNWEWELTCKDGSTKTIAWSNISARFPVSGWATWGVGVDVTQREQAVEKLRDSEAKYRLMADNVTDVIWTAALEGADDLAERLKSHDPALVVEELMRRWQFTYVSPSVERFLGYRVEEVMARTIQDLLAADSYAEAKIALAQELVAEQHQPGEHGQRMLENKHRTKDGSLRWGEVRTAFLRDEQMRPVGVLGVTRDITERKQAEQALRTSEAKLRSLFENLPDVVLTVDRQATIQLINHGIPPVTPEELVGSNGFRLVAPEHQHVYREVFQQALATQQTQTAEILDVFGSWWACRLVPIIEEGQVRNVMVICTDVTQQRRAAQAIQKEQQLLRHLLDLHEQDRKLTAYEIHDGFSQYLTGALYNLQGFRELHAKKPLEAWRTFDAGLALIQRSLHEARRLIGGLRPPILDESGIVAAIDYLVCEAEESRETQVEFVHDVQFQRLALPLESAIFRIVQESLSNARRHSRSAKIRIELREQHDCIHIGVRDWGIGFDPVKVEEGRFGLQGIRERARLLGGQVRIETAPNQGTHIHVELPLIEAAGPEP